MVRSREPQVSFTVRLPTELASRAKATKTKDESLNDVVLSAVEREVRRRELEQLLEDVDRLRDEIKAEHGILPNSVPLIRSLREGIGRRD